MPGTARRLPAVPERGSVFVLVLFLVIVLSGLAYASFRSGLGERQAGVHAETSLRALEIAETGLLLGEIEVRTLHDADGDGIGTLSGVHDGGTYDVEATQHPTLPDHWILISTGQHGLSVRRLEVELRRTPGSPFQYALFATNAIDVGGSVTTDAYDSRLGPWIDQAVYTDADGTHSGGGGDVASNGDIRLSGSSQTIRGHAQPGPLGTFTADGSPTVWGDTAPLDRELALPDTPLAAFQDAYLNNDNAQLIAHPGYDAAAMSVAATSGDDVVLQGGTYFFTDISLGGSAALIVQGPSRVFLTGNCHLTAGGVVNQSEKAADLLLFVHPYPLPAGYVRTPQGSLPTVVLSGGAQASFAVYAPAADVDLSGNTAVYGAVVGRQVSVSGSPIFHYDRSLGSLEWPGPRDAERVYWVERNQPPR